MKQFQSQYGYFNDTGDEYIITRPDTPRPWVNVICPGDYGLVISQTGGGYSWRTHASLNQITRWEQDLVKDNWGKYFFIRDNANGDFWSPAWKPVCKTPDYYQVRHGIGYSEISSRNNKIGSRVRVFVPQGEPVEIWEVELTNESSAVKDLSVFSYFEWLLGAGPDTHREFHKTFIETEFDSVLNAMWATKRLWAIPNQKGQHWNRDWEYYAFHSVSETVSGFEGDKESFLGNYGSLREPAAVRQNHLTGTCGKWTDAIGSLHNSIILQPGESKTLIYLIGAVQREEREKANALITKYRSLEAVELAFQATKQFWANLLNTTEVKTPDPGFDLMNNKWLKYQAISARLWGRTGYYQAGGAYGFRDQLQDSQVFLYIDPEQTAQQIKLHAAHQFPEGRVNHWWHPISEIGMENKISDNLLWLPFVTVKYLKETGRVVFLDETVPYKNGQEATIYEHCCQAIDYSLSQKSERGLPLIGDGDWNDGLNAVGSGGKGESIWLAEFLCGILKEFAVVAQKKHDRIRSDRYLAEAEQFKKLVNDCGWDGEWYQRAFCDNGKVLGSSQCDSGKIYLNAQSWAIINDVADMQRATQAYRSMEKYLIRKYGPLLLYPAYKTPDTDIGYLSRYAPGLRENGGLYTHAGTWAVLAACKMGYNDQAYQIYKSFLSPYRGEEPDLYKVEPYVTPGNVDGPDSPNFGRGGWTWYTGSASWSFIVAMEGILGITAEWDGLKITPHVPEEWEHFSVERRFRGSVYRISYRRSGNGQGQPQIYLDGVALDGNLITPDLHGQVHQVEVIG